MPSAADRTVPAVVSNGNGAHKEPNGRPETPTGTMSLTEYSVNPSTPPSEEARTRMKQLVPEDLLLPNGYPDVSNPKWRLRYWFRAFSLILNRF